MAFLRDWWYPVARCDTWNGPTCVQLFGESLWLDLERPTVPVVERYGLVWVCVGRPVTPGPPSWPEADLAGWRVGVEFFEMWSAAAPRIIDNNLDASHVAFVHRTTFGDPTDARIPAPSVEWLPDGGFRSTVRTQLPGIGVQLGVTDDETRRFERVTETDLLAPLTTRIRLRYHGAGPDYSFYGVATPVDDTTSIYVRITALGGTPQEQPWERFHAFGSRVTAEDRVVLETTDPDFPLDVVSEVHLRCDAPTIAYRRALARHLERYDSCS
jgi:phenylpropionate dioxygenase-like ring-hydroxylating dioxygenase large terminal subunit